MAGMKKSVVFYALIVLALAFYAIKVSDQPVAWLIGLVVSIPVFAAIAGNLEKQL
jgi:hypothetical protein